MRSALFVALLVAAGAAAGEPLPEGPGLAARYPGDEGLGTDPAVLLHETFEEGSLEEILARWSDVSNEGGRVLALSEETPGAGPGGRSLAVTATRDADTGGHLYRVLPREVDTAFARFYVRFEEAPGYIHHFVHLGGYRPSSRWPQGGAGERPAGDERVTVGIEPHGDYGRFPPPGAWSFYCYWPEMRISGDGRYWGNALRPATPQLVPAGRWQCVEIMLKLNSAPDVSDGELALWLDGALVAHFARGAARDKWTGLGFDLLTEGGEPFEGFRWRTDADLRINFLWLLHYVTGQAASANNVADPSATNTVWFDDIVVATDYIGPTAPR